MMTKKAKIYIITMTIFSFIYNIILPLHPDEAYYWVWSRNLQLSYFDHPPMVAYFIKLVTIIGTDEIFIRLAAVLSISISACLIYKMAEDMFGEKIAERSLLLFLLMPVVQAGYIVVTPDSPLVLFWTLTIYFFYQYVFKGKTTKIILAGISAGFLLLSKYTGILLLISLFLYLIFSEKRKILAKRELYISIILAFIIFLPVLIWNYQYDWVSFKFQFSHGVSSEKVFHPLYLSEFVGAQIFIFNPVFFITIIIFLLKKAKELINNRYLYFLFFPFIVTLTFFIYQSAFKRGEVNWPAPAYITAVIILAYLIEKYKLKKVFYTGIIFAVLLFILVRFPEVIPGLPEEAVLKAKFYGYDRIYTTASNYLKDDTIVLSDNYQNASEAAYYLKDRPDVYIITKSRFSNYNYWSKEIKDNIKQGKVKTALYIGKNDRKSELKNYFQRVKLIDTIKYSDKYIERVFYVYKCFNE